MTSPFVWPVTTSPVRHDCETVAMFFTEGDAADFVNADERNLFIAPPRYDRRPFGYRPAEKPSGYEAWLREIEAEQLTECVGDPMRRVA